MAGHSVVQVRAESPLDHARVFEVEKEAFKNDLEADLVETLRRSADPQLSLVALVDGILVGHIFFSPVTMDSKAAPSMAQLSPLAVIPSHQRKGIGSALVHAGLEQCPSRGWSAVFVVGDPRYYSRFGFQLASPLGFSYGGKYDAFLQVLEISPGAIGRASGRITLHPAFAALGE
jgi:putative acetyltransferase